MFQTSVCECVTFTHLLADIWNMFNVLNDGIFANLKWSLFHTVYRLVMCMHVRCTCSSLYMEFSLVFAMQISLWHTYAMIAKIPSVFSQQFLTKHYATTTAATQKLANFIKTTIWVEKHFDIVRVNGSRFTENNPAFLGICNRVYTEGGIV